MLSSRSKYQLFFIKEFRDLYPVKTSMLTHALGELATILLYWYTAKALAPKLEFSGEMGGDYFSYIMLGELTLLIPATLLYHYTKAIKEMSRDHITSYLVTQSYNKTVFLLESVSSVFILRGIQLSLTMITIHLFFNFSFPLNQLLAFGIAIAVSLPSFVGLGLVAASIVLRWGRGERVIIMLSNSAYILAGVYFPTDVFPKYLGTLLDIISPFNLLLGVVRKINQQTYEVFDLLSSLGIIFLNSCILFLLGYLAMEYSFKKVIHRKKPLLI